MKNAYTFQLFKKSKSKQIQNDKIQNEKIQNEKIQNEKIQNEKIPNKYQKTLKNKGDAVRFENFRFEKRTKMTKNAFLPSNPFCKNH